MKQITFEDIKKTVLTLSEGPEEKFISELDLMTGEQPEITDFLLNREVLNKDEMDLLMLVARSGWYVVKTVLGRNKRISEDFLYEQFNRNFVRYRDSRQDKETGDSEFAAEALHTPNNQPVLMNYLAQLIIEKTEEPGSPVRESMATAMIIDVKTVIDCLVLDEDTELAETRDKDFSDESFQSVKESMAAYLKEFRNTYSYMILKQNEKDDSEMIIMAFGELMYRFFLMHPAHWNARRAVECVGEIMPAKIMADEAFFEAVEPVLYRFMLFCDEKGYAPEGGTIAGRLAGITGRVIEQAGNEDHWGMGKSVLKEAEKKGVNLSNRDELEAFIKNYNKEKAVMPGIPGAGRTDKPGRNDPCPCGSGKKYKKCCGIDK